MADQQAAHEAAPAENRPEVRLVLEDWLPFQLSFIANRVSQSLESFYRSRFGMTVASWRVMAVVGFQSPLSAGEVAELAAMDQVQVTRAVNHLHELGLIGRRTDRVDRRKVNLALTAKGRDVYMQIVPRAHAIEQQLLSGLSAEELDELRRQVQRVARNAHDLT